VDPIALARTLDGFDYLGGHPFVIREYAPGAKNKATCEQLGHETVMKLGDTPAKKAEPSFDSPALSDQVLAEWTIDAKLHLREGDDATTAEHKTFEVVVLCHEADSVGFYIVGLPNDARARFTCVRGLASSRHRMPARSIQMRFRRFEKSSDPKPSRRDAARVSI